MRIATFNLENLSNQPGKDFLLARRCEILRPQLVRLRADILCLQEVGAEHAGPKAVPRTFEALTRLLEGTPYADYFMAHSAQKESQDPLDVHNLVILSRFPIIRQCQLWNDLVSPPQYRIATAEPRSSNLEELGWDRPVLRVDVDIGGNRVLHIFNLHLRAPLASFIPGQKLGQFKWRTVSGWAEGFFAAAVKRSGQALEVRFAVDQLFDDQADALIAVCGDMNAEEHEMPLRIMRGDESETENPDLASRMLIPMENAAPERRRYTVVHGGRGAMLDHMLVSRALFGRFEHIHINNETLSDELTDYQDRVPELVSHHAPMVARFAPFE